MVYNIGEIPIEKIRQKLLELGISRIEGSPRNAGQVNYFDEP